MRSTAFLRLDQLPAAAAIGYLPRRGWRTNQLQLPMRGAGDGGAYSTASDIARLWAALFDGRIVPLTALTEMLRPQSDRGPTSHQYGLGVWLAKGREAVFMEGNDAGISFRSSFDPATGVLYSVFSNTTSGAWPVVQAIETNLAGLRG